MCSKETVRLALGPMRCGRKRRAREDGSCCARTSALVHPLDRRIQAEGRGKGAHGEEVCARKSDRMSGA
eukprot:6175559-Pleurochrysis_carterae.AAC.1